MAREVGHIDVQVSCLTGQNTNYVSGHFNCRCVKDEAVEAR